MGTKIKDMDTRSKRNQIICRYTQIIINTTRMKLITEYINWTTGELDTIYLNNYWRTVELITEIRDCVRTGNNTYIKN